MNNLTTSNCSGSNIIEMLLHVSGLQYAIESQVPSVCMYCLCKPRFNLWHQIVPIFPVRGWQSLRATATLPCMMVPTSWLNFAICKACSMLM